MVWHKQVRSPWPHRVLIGWVQHAVVAVCSLWSNCWPHGETFRWAHCDWALAHIFTGLLRHQGKALGHTTQQQQLFHKGLKYQKKKITLRSKGFESSTACFAKNHQYTIKELEWKPLLKRCYARPAENFSEVLISNLSVYDLKRVTCQDTGARDKTAE